MNHTSTTPIAIAARPEVRFDFTSTPAIHHANNPYLSHFWNALSIMTPATERVLIRIARSLRDEVTDERIRTDIDALVMQEALHTREHRRLNTRLDELGYAVTESTTEMDRILDDYISRVDAASAAALMVAGEHLIYELCSALVDHPAVTSDMDQQVRGLLTWHAAEEMEHQSVAYDMYVHLYGNGLRSRLRRVQAFGAATRLLGVGGIRISRRLLAAEPASDRRAQRTAFFRFMLLTPGYGRTVAAHSLRFLLPRFRPWHNPHDPRRIQHALASI